MTVISEGQILAGKYRVERVLATGGMGVVVAALHTQLDQRVALKFLLPEGEANEHARGRFLREARAAVRLRSEHVARVLDVGTADTGSPYIVMEYLEGQDLSDVLAERGRLAVQDAVGFVLQAAEAVAEAHALGIVHRDLKPANLFLTVRPDGSACVKVLDFGIAKTMGDLGSLTQTRALIGTPHYLSPEQVRSSRSADTRSDIWAMGMILYELVTGVVAFPRETLPELCSAIILDDIPPIREKRPDIHPELERVIGWALSKAPDNRPQSLGELAVALAPFAPGGGEAAARIARILEGAPRASSPSFHELEAPPSDRVANVAPVRAPAPSTPEVAARAQFAATLRVEEGALDDVPAPSSEAVHPTPFVRRPTMVVAVCAGLLAASAIVALAFARHRTPSPSPSPSSLSPEPSIASSISSAISPGPLALEASSEPSSPQPRIPPTADLPPPSPIAPSWSAPAVRAPAARGPRAAPSSAGSFDDLGPRK